MGFRFLGESDRRLDSLDNRARRKLYRIAAFRSYLNLKTYFGVLLLSIGAFFGEEIAKLFFVLKEGDLASKAEKIALIDPLLFLVGFFLASWFQKKEPI